MGTTGGRIGQFPCADFGRQRGSYPPTPPGPLMLRFFAKKTKNVARKLQTMHVQGFYVFRVLGLRCWVYGSRVWGFRGVWCQGVLAFLVVVSFPEFSNCSNWF